MVCRTFLFNRPLLFNLLIHGFQIYSSNILPGHRSESNPHSPVDRCRWGSPIPSSAPWSRPMRHGHVQFILDPSAVNGDHSPIPEQQLHAPGVHVEFAGSFIVLHVCVLSALRHSYRGLSCFLMIRSRTFFDGSKGFVLFSKENKKSEPFSYREKVRIFMVWCTSRDSNPGPTD